MGLHSCVCILLVGLVAVIECKRLYARQNCGCAAGLCCSQWGYCGTGNDYCGNGCQSGPCSNGGGGDTGGSGGNSIVTESIFACGFPALDPSTRARRYQGLKQTGWQPANRDEAAIFLAHVSHESDGLKAYVEYCAQAGTCTDNYQGSWCEIQAAPGRKYYGRGWFQLSWPCNYWNAGRALGLDLWGNPDLVAQSDKVAADTALWFYRANNMHSAAQRGDFASTTRIINGAQECNGGPGASSQRLRIDRYQSMRRCFGLGEATTNVWC